MRIEKEVEKVVKEIMGIDLCEKCGEPIDDGCCHIRVFRVVGFGIQEVYWDYHKECRRKVLEEIGVKDWNLKTEHTIDLENEAVTGTTPCACCGDTAPIGWWSFYPFSSTDSGHVKICRHCFDTKIRPKLRDESKMPEGAVE